MKIIAPTSVSAFFTICRNNENIQQNFSFASSLSGKSHDWHGGRQTVVAPGKGDNIMKKLALSQTMESRQDKAKQANGLI